MKTQHGFATAFGLVVGLSLCPPAYGAEAAALNPLKEIDKATLKGFLTRPLFDPARQLPPVAPPQPVAVAPPPATPPEPPPTLHLIGVIQGERDMAVVHRDGAEKTIILRTGDHVGDWQVVVLRSAGIKLQSGSRSVTYAMFSKNTATDGAALADGDASGKSKDLATAMAARNARLSRRTY